jgi:hypothetical protein
VKSEPLVVLRVRYGLAPLRGTGAVHGNMHEGRLRTSAVEMPFARSNVDHVTGLEQVSALPSRSHAPTTRDAIEELPARMAVPVGPPGRREVDHPDVGPVGNGDGATQPDLASEPPSVATLEDPVRRARHVHIHTLSARDRSGGASPDRALRPATMLMA